MSKLSDGQPSSSQLGMKVGNVDEFLTSWTFMILMAGLLCFFVLLIPVMIIVAIIFVRRANRDNSTDRD
jgi:hypothetical protein